MIMLTISSQVLDDSQTRLSVSYSRVQMMLFSVLVYAEAVPFRVLHAMSEEGEFDRLAEDHAFFA